MCIVVASKRKKAKATHTESRIGIKNHDPMGTLLPFAFLGLADWALIFYQILKHDLELDIFSERGIWQFDSES